MRATLDWGNVQPHEIWRAAREGACPIIAADDTGLGPGTTYQVLSWADADALLRDAREVREVDGGWLVRAPMDTHWQLWLRIDKEWAVMEKWKAEE